MIYSVVIDNDISAIDMGRIQSRLSPPIVGKIAVCYVLFFNYNEVVNVVRNLNLRHLVLLKMEGYFILSDRNIIRTDLTEYIIICRL